MIIVALMLLSNFGDENRAGSINSSKAGFRQQLYLCCVPPTNNHSIYNLIYHADHIRISFSAETEQDENRNVLYER